MKLKNKKTGEIVIADITRMVSGVEFDCGQTLAELNAEWEDVPEEPKTVYWVDTEHGIVNDCTEPEFHRTVDDYWNKQIGNYFETEEEAEEAVRKLKAWKRLKDKGFRFKGYTDDSGDLFSCQVIRCSFDDFGKESREDIDLLFSGGEE